MHAVVNVALLQSGETGAREDAIVLGRIHPLSRGDIGLAPCTKSRK